MRPGADANRSGEGRDVTQRSQIEVLAPAGEIDHAKAAVLGGADAVYVGLRGFSARPDAWSMGLSEIEQVSTYLHSKGKRLHVAINAELPEKKRKELSNAIERLEDIDVDALIVGDFGVFACLRDVGCEVPLHASTLLGLYNAEGIRLVREEFGIRRVVLNTNLYVDEIAQLHFQCPDIEFELIAHGGVCFNDGRRCRQPHYLFEKEFCVGCKQIYEAHQSFVSCNSKQKLSTVASQIRPADVQLPGGRLIWSPEIDSSENIDLFIRLGVVSFKIEGRTRTAEYVRSTTHKYRNAVDAAVNDPKNVDADTTPFYYIEHHSRLRPDG